MSGDNADLQAKLAALRTQFGDGLAERMRDLEAAADGIAAPLDDNGFAAVKNLRDHAHKMSGSAPTFGYTTVGDCAYELEMVCEAILADRDNPSPSNIGDIEPLVGKVSAAVEDGADN